MKTKSDKWQVSSDKRNRPASGSHPFHPSPVTRHFEKGIALIITLILLSVTLVMALAFLAISRRENSAVATAGDTATARLAADAALASAEAQTMAGILSSTNPYNFGLIVSTNYINPNGFDATVPFQSINYDHLIGSSAPLLQNQFLTMLTNLWYSPRPPVFVPNPPGNYASPLSYDFRFYLDLNRNGKFDTNGWVTNVDINGLSLGTTSFQVGDPEWIGVLAHPDQPYGLNNPFVARFAFIALPVGNSLDLDAIHNQTVTRTADVNSSSFASDGFFRNQGVGSWEINLAAFLADLNTNQWDTNTSPYIYQQWMTPAFPNTGAAFQDALSLLSYRYNYNYNSLYPVGGPTGLFTNSTTTFPPFQNDIDLYSDGPLQNNTPGIYVSAQAINLPWAGADNTNHFFDLTADLFDPTKTSGGATGGFINRLLNADTGVSTYDRYTFYRLLSQLGTDTTSETGKMNLNYRNITNGVIVPSMETNFYAWTPLEFFTNAADRMLRAYTANWINQGPNAFGVFTNTFGASTTNAFGIGNIPVYVNGQFVYTPAVNRILQLAANMYDATVNNRVNNSTPDYPDVFRPLFSRSGTNIYIMGYTNLNSASGPNTVSGPADLQLSQPFEITTIANLSSATISSDVNIYGVPWIIGAKKGFPNFNEFSVENNLGVTRRLQLTRTTNASLVTPPTITGTNQMYTMSLASQLGVELWNSYAAAYPGTVLIGLNETASLTITNDEGLPTAEPGIPQNIVFTTNNISNPYQITSWPGTAPWYAGKPTAASFVIATFTGPTLTNSVYRSPYATGATLPPGLTAPCLIPTNYFGIITPPSPLLFESNSPNGFHFPQFGVIMTNRLQVFMLDVTNNIYHVIDYVHFNGPDTNFNINTYLADSDINDPKHPGVWNTNYTTANLPTTAPTIGILNQISISKSGSPPLEDGLWQPDPEAVPLGGTIAQQQAFFQAFFLPGNHYGTTTNLLLSVDAPYAPTRYIVQYVTWQANDPLVHYLASDIDAPSPNNTTTPIQGVSVSSASAQTIAPLTSLNLGWLNDRFAPWGGNPSLTAAQSPLPPDPDAYNLAERDPLVFSPDNWDFPTNKFPTIGWLGRVHRGTPWQTVYLKSSNILSSVNGLSTWATWTGDLMISSNQYFDADNSTPAQDWRLFDLFTTAFNENATRGQLSVNVGAGSSDPAAGLAAWSALFSGIALPPVSLTNLYTVIAPVGNQAISSSSLGILITNINYARANFVNADGLTGTFENVGDILAVPQLTVQSPFLNPANTNYNSDEMYEWLPQQTMSLLRVGTPRYVIYSYGQTLKPAPNGVSLGTTVNGTFGMVTNYQVVSEMATRAVVRFDSTLTNILGTNRVINNHAVIENYNILPPD